MRKQTVLQIASCDDTFVILLPKKFKKSYFLRIQLINY